MRAYLDNASTTKMSRAAIEAMLPYLDTVYGNPSSLHSMGQRAKEALEEARERVAACLGANASEIYFTSGGSESDNQAILSAAAIGARKGKKRIVTTAFEHHAVLHTLRKLEKSGYEVVYLPVGREGNIAPSAVREAINEETALVTVMTANNEIGSVLPIQEIGAICREKKVIFHTDAVQAVGHIPVNVGRMQVDMLSLSGHKFHGPKGVGVLYVRKGIPLTNLIEGGAQEGGKRAGTENVAGIVALAAALKNKTIAGAGVDVLSTEPPPRANPLLSCENCIITPHIAWAGFETRRRLMKICEENIRAFVKGKPQNVVNNL